MTHSLQHTLLGLALAAAGLAHAQDDLSDLRLLMAQADVERQVFIGDGAEAFVYAGAEHGAERVIKGAPYCAEGVHETVQWLPDGNGGAPNRIVRQQSTQLCRDGEGRTRQEVQRGSRKLVYLRDPVARESWVLDPEQKTARRIGGRTAANLDSAAWREYSERMRDWARGMADRARQDKDARTAPTPPVPPVPATPAAPAAPSALPPLPPLLSGTAPTPVVISRSEAGGQTQTEVNIVRLRNDERQAGADWAMAPPAVALRAQSWAPRGQGSVTPLGIRELDGVRANGERTSWTIEAGKVGNEKPIQITREVWTAPDLMVTLSSRDFDPRSGEVNYRLKNLRRGEPDAALMRVPGDYRQPGARPGGRASGPTG